MQQRARPRQPVSLSLVSHLNFFRLIQTVASSVRRSVPVFRSPVTLSRFSRETTSATLGTLSPAASTITLHRRQRRQALSSRLLRRSVTALKPVVSLYMEALQRQDNSWLSPLQPFKTSRL